MTTPFDFDIDKRRMPSSQVEAGPRVDPNDPAAAASYKANYFPHDVEFEPTDSLLFNKYIMQNTPRDSSLFSPVFNSIASIPREKLAEKGPKGQAIRRKVLRGASVLIVSGGYSGKKFIYERLKELGVSVTIMDGPDSIWKTEQQEGLIDHFLPIDFSDYSTIFERAMQIVDASGLTFDACTTYYEDSVPLAARMARALCVETNPPEACDKARNKHTTRQVMAQCGLATPKYYRINSEDDLKKATAEMTWPAILKPVYGASSLGVVRCENPEQTLENYFKILKVMNVEDDTIWAQGTEMVLEEYYDGDEFDVDILLSDGVPVYAAISDNFACWEPYFQETGTCCPSVYPIAKQEEIKKLALDTTLALGFRWGCFHVELKYTSNGPRMIEVNARMGGVSIHEANLRAWGVDLVEEHIMAALKIPICPDVPEKPLGYFVEIGINAPYSGTITSGSSWLLDKLQSDIAKRLITKCHLEKDKGDKVIGPEDGMPDWLADIRFCSENNMDEVLEFVVDLIHNQLKGRVPIMPNDKSQKKELFFPSAYHPFTRKLQ